MYIFYLQFEYTPTFAYFFQKAAEMVHSCVSKLNSRRQVTFLIGSAGPLSLGAVLHNNIDIEESRAMISKLV